MTYPREGEGKKRSYWWAYPLGLALVVAVIAGLLLYGRGEARGPGRTFSPMPEQGPEAGLETPVEPGAPGGPAEARPPTGVDQIDDDSPIGIERPGTGRPSFEDPRVDQIPGVQEGDLPPERRPDPEAVAPAGEALRMDELGADAIASMNAAPEAFDGRPLALGAARVEQVLGPGVVLLGPVSEAEQAPAGARGGAGARQLLAIGAGGEGDPPEVGEVVQVQGTVRALGAEHASHPQLPAGVNLSGLGEVNVYLEVERLEPRGGSGAARPAP